jgi:hypothetical protein
MELHPVALASAWEAINAVGGVATTDDDKQYVATLNLITGYIEHLQEKCMSGEKFDDIQKHLPEDLRLRYFELEDWINGSGTTMPEECSLRWEHMLIERIAKLSAVIVEHSFSSSVTE